MDVEEDWKGSGCYQYQNQKHIVRGFLVHNQRAKYPNLLDMKWHFQLWQ
jgi:hypothetical protein